MFVAYRKLDEDKNRVDEKGKPVPQSSISYPSAEIDRAIPAKANRETKRYLPLQLTFTDNLADIEAGLAASYIGGVLIEKKEQNDPMPIFEIYLEDGKIRKYMSAEIASFIESGVGILLGVQSKDEFASLDKEYRKRMVKEIAKSLEKMLLYEMEIQPVPF